MKFSNRSIVYFIFFLSGISGLIYETVWLRVLSRVLGYTVYANSIVISAFMLGLSLGSFYIGKKSDTFKNLFKTYAILEILVGITAVLAFVILNHLGGLFKFFFHVVNENRTILYLIQSIIVFIIIVIPTLLMGGTLPLLAAALKNYKGSFAKNIGNLYGLNTLGAVFGVFISGYITIGFIGELNTMLISMLINFIVGFIALLLLSRPNCDIGQSQGNISSNSGFSISPYNLNIRNLVLITYSIIGFTSFSIEIIWTRMFQLQIGTSIYAFSMVLGIYLLGSATGSILSSKFINYFKNPLIAIAYILFFLGLYLIIGALIFTFFIPAQIDIQFEFGISKFFIPLIIIFPFTLLLGFIFPLVSFCFVPNKFKIGNKIGILYSFNTLGCIFGALVTGYVFINFIGTRNCIILISSILVFMGIINFIAGKNMVKSKFKVLYLLVFIIIFSGYNILIFEIPDPFYTVINKIITNSKNSAFFSKEKVLFNKEGIAATTTVLGNANDPLDRFLLINGVGITKLDPVTKIMAHLPILLNKDTKDVLIICFGMGTCLKSAVSHSNIQCDVVELVGEEYAAFNYFHKEGNIILANSRVHHFVDDGRNFLLLRDKKYDVITIDPSPPLWSAGTVNLHTSDFFTLCKEHLNSNGLICLWIAPFNLYDIEMIMKTFTTVFPNSLLYRGPTFPGFFLIGSKNNIKIDSNNFKNAEKDINVMKDINEWGIIFKSPLELLNYKLADSNQLKLFLKDQKVISDNNPYTEFPLWRKIIVVESTRFKILMDLSSAHVITDVSSKGIKYK